VFSFQPDLDVRKIRDLATLAFIETHTSVALLGPPGVGKTHLACSLAVAACQAGHMTYYTSLDDMVGKLRAADGAGSLSRQSRTYLRPSLLARRKAGGAERAARWRYQGGHCGRSAAAPRSSTARGGCPGPSLQCRPRLMVILVYATARRGVRGQCANRPGAAGGNKRDRDGCGADPRGAVEGDPGYWLGNATRCSIVSR
jgi:hypothetical protein